MTRAELRRVSWAEARIYAGLLGAYYAHFGHDPDDDMTDILIMQARLIAAEPPGAFH